MMQQSTTIIKSLIFRNYSVFDEPHFLKNLRRNLRVFPLIIVCGADIYCAVTICLTCTRCIEERQESEYIAWGSTQLSVSRFHSCTAIPNFTQKTSLYLWWETKIHNSLKHSKRLMHVKRAYVLGQDWARKVYRFSVLFGYFDEVRAELVRDISRSLRFLLCIL